MDADGASRAVSHEAVGASSWRPCRASPMGETFNRARARQRARRLGRAPPLPAIAAAALDVSAAASLATRCHELEHSSALAHQELILLRLQIGELALRLERVVSPARGTSAAPEEVPAERCDKPSFASVGVQVPKPLPPAPAADGARRMSRRERRSRRRRSGFLDDLLHKPADDLLYTPDQATRPFVPPVGSLVAGQRAAPLTLQPAGPIASSGVSFADRKAPPRHAARLAARIAARRPADLAERGSIQRWWRAHKLHRQCSARKLQRWWREAPAAWSADAVPTRRPVRRAGLREGAAFGANVRAARLQAAWRGFAVRRAQRLLDAEADADWLALLPTRPAQLSFAIRFACPARREERRATGRAALTAALGRAWASALRELSSMELPTPPDDPSDDVYSLEDEVREAVCQVLQPLRRAKRLQFEAVKGAFLEASTGIRSTANVARHHLMTVGGFSAAEADAMVAAEIAEDIRLRRAAFRNPS